MKTTPTTSLCIASTAVLNTGVGVLASVWLVLSSVDVICG